MSSRSLAPGLLLASPRLGDPNFDHTVVLLARHDGEGALGWVINGRALEPVGPLLARAGLVPEGVKLLTTEPFCRPARVGGPVMPSSGWILHRSSEGVLPAAVSAGTELAVTGDRDALDLVIRGGFRGDFRLLLGYAGWGPGQLEGELRAGAWLPAAVSAALLFDTAPEAVWDAAYHVTIGSSAGAFTSSRGGSA